MFVENLSREIVTKDIKSSHSPIEGMPDTWVIRDAATGKIHRAPTPVLSFCMFYNELDAQDATAYVEGQ